MQDTKYAPLYVSHLEDTSQDLVKTFPTELGAPICWSTVFRYNPLLSVSHKLPKPLIGCGNVEM